MPNHQNIESLHQQISLAKHDFDLWRRAKGYQRERTPDKLRKVAVCIANQIGPHQASKELGVSLNGLKRWTSPPPNSIVKDFVEVTTAPTQSLECRVDLNRNETAISISIQGTTVEQMITLIRGVS